MQTGDIVSSESHPLLSSHKAVSTTFRSRSRMTSAATGMCSFTKYLLSRLSGKLTKPAIILIVINMFISSLYNIISNVLIEGGYLYGNMPSSSLHFYSFMVVVGLFYPVSGFLADVYCGRYRVIFVGVSLIFGACVILALSCFFVITLLDSKSLILSDYSTPFINCIAFIMIVICFVGLACYRANFIQFGLDQLLEAPSTSLVLFIHWIIWADNLGKFITDTLFGIIVCALKSQIVNFHVEACALGYIILVMVSLTLVNLLLLEFCDFYDEPKRYNPYKIVFKILDYARKHNYPVCRSAFTYCDDELPSRLDFAKGNYGGPFTTEQVEDVKTFLRILLVFVALGPVFVLDVPATTFVSFLFGIHVIGKQSSTVNHSCSARFILLTSGGLINLVSVMILPMYMFFILRRCAPRIFSRLLLAVVLYLLGVVGMLCIDLIGHHIADRSGTAGSSYVHVYWHIPATSPSTTLVSVVASRSACWNWSVLGHSYII